MNYKEPSKTIIFSTIILIVVNFYLSYMFYGKSIAYTIGNIFGFTIITIVISSFFSKYRNSHSRWIITLNTMIITFIILLSGYFIKATKEIGYTNINKIEVKKQT